MIPLRLLLACALSLAAVGHAAAEESWWTPQRGVLAPTSPRGARQTVQADRFRTFALDTARLRAALQTAPTEERRAAAEPLVLSLPTPTGGFERFAVERTALLAPELAGQFPEFVTLTGRGLDDPRSFVRLSWTELGFHAQVLRPGDAWYIDPFYRGETGLYLVYAKREAYRPAAQRLRDRSQPSGERSRAPGALTEASFGEQLRTYRLAVACTGEYAAVFGGTTNAALSAVVVTINRVTGLFERDLSIRFQLVANNAALIYLNPATDPYTNADPDLLRSQNQANLDAVIGDANYDLGHVLCTSDAGTSLQGSVCATGIKARAVTGTFAPSGDPFDVDYVAHEFGHQFDATHTFDSISGFCAGNRNGASAYEPGSGSTIMATAGVCDADDLQIGNDAYFHGASIDAIQRYVTVLGGSTCPTLSATGNRAPTLVLPANATIPNGTPFALSAVGSDADGDPLTYCWEQFDTDLASSGHALSDPDNGRLPLFRSFAPVASGTRTFPRLADLLAGTSTPGERLPSFTGAPARPLTFRCTVRDGRGGVLTSNPVVLTVATAAGPFVVNAPGAGANWTAGTTQTVTWNVAGTSASPINTANVDILLSRDGGQTFPITLAAGVPNTGSATFAVPYVAASAQAWVKIVAVGNVYFALSPSNFTLQAAADTDGDGLPDAYEIANGLNPNNPADAALDADGDGQSNLAEFIARTDPRNSAESLRIASTTRDGSGFTVTFPSKLNVNYQLERSADLLGPWNAVGSVVAGTGGNLSRNDPAGTGGPKFFYRVRAFTP
ncbi:MAG: hypothetical protein JSR82_07885 [Verrucomicrobia bacterium]|nr:hypothetical protein [Verrucomicrobiota bacterium]